MPSQDRHDDAEVRAFYEEKAPIYRNSGSAMGGRERIVLALFPVAGRLRVLDAGCGSGTFLRLLESLGHEPVGLDISRAAVESVRQSGARALVANAETGEGLDEVGRDFDVVTCLDFLEHTFEPSRVLRRLSMLLKPNGCLIACVPNIGCITARLTVLNGHFPSRSDGIFDSGHIRWFTRSNLPQYLDPVPELQLAVLRGTPIPPASVWGLWRMEKLQTRMLSALARLWPSLWAYQLVIKLVRMG
jgi:SAM-dependent methyltransferase